MNPARADRHRATPAAMSKRRRAVRAVSILAISLTIAGCAQNDVGTKEQIGTGAGALLGGVAGAFLGKGSGKAVAILAGAALGGLVGNRVGAILDENDRKANPPAPRRRGTGA